MKRVGVVYDPSSLDDEVLASSVWAMANLECPSSTLEELNKEMTKGCVRLKATTAINGAFPALQVLGPLRTARKVTHS